MAGAGATARVDLRLPARTVDLEACFARACDAAGGGTELTYVIAGLGVRIRYAGRSMLDRIGRALAHLEQASVNKVLLTIDAWDSSATDAASPPLPPVEDAAVPGARYYLDDGRLRVSYMPASGALNVFDRAATHGWYWAADAEEMPDWEAAASIRVLLHWWLPDHGVVELHGGAIGTEHGGALVVGRGGSGKSTTCLASLGHAQLRYVSDDYTAVRAEPDPRAYSLYSSGKLEPAHATRLPHLASAVANKHRLHLEEKAVFYVNEAFPDSVISELPLRAVLVPRIVAGRREPALVEASPATALSALAPSTVFQLHPSSPETFRRMADLLRRVPSFHLDLGSDIPAIPNAVLELLERLRVGQ